MRGTVANWNKALLIAQGTQGRLLQDRQTRDRAHDVYETVRAIRDCVLDISESIKAGVWGEKDSWNLAEKVILEIDVSSRELRRAGVVAVVEHHMIKEIVS